MKSRSIITLLLLAALSFSSHGVHSQQLPPSLILKLQTTIDSIRNAYNLQGVAACVQIPGLGKWKGASGISHPGVPLTSEHLFGIASNTKLFTGVLLLKLAASNLINLNDSLHRYLPPLTNINPNITIRQLLNHTSGLFDVTTIQGYPDSILTNPNRIFTPSEILSWAGSPLFNPGSSWNYCNTNYLLAGLIAEKATNRSYGSLLRDSILHPLMMDSTFLDVYDSLTGVIAHPWQGGNNYINTPRKALNSAAWAAGAMYSTVDEMVQWYSALMNGALLTPAMFNEMVTFVGSGNYGIGISKAIHAGRTVWQHGGSIWGGYNSMMMFDSTSGVIVSVMINQLPAQALMVARQLLLSSVNFAVSTLNLDEASILRVYPNPVRDILNISGANDKPCKYKLFTASGQLVLETEEDKIPMDKLPSGIYMIEISRNQTSHRYKIVKL